MTLHPLRPLRGLVAVALAAALALAGCNDDDDDASIPNDQMQAVLDELATLGAQPIES